MIAMLTPRFARALICVAAIVCCRALWPATAVAGQTASCSAAVLTLDEAATLLRVDAENLQRLAESGTVPGRRIGTVWRFDCTALMSWLRGTDVSARGLGDSQQQNGPLPASKPEPDSAIGEAPEERTAEDVFLRGNRVLLERGDVVVDVGQFYARSDAMQLLGVGGLAGLGTLEQTALTTLLVARVGVMSETEVFVSTSFSRQDRRELLGNVTVASSDRADVGGTAIGIRRTVLHEGVGRPDVVLTLNGQLPTGNGARAVGGGVIVVKSIDPVVLFASGNYVHPLAARSSGGVRSSPPDTVDVSMGYGLGLNDTLAISMGVGGVFATAGGEPGTSRPASVFSVRFGLTTSIAPRLYLEPSVSLGLSGPGHRFAIGVTMPFAF